SFVPPNLPPRLRFRLARPASPQSVAARPVRGVLELPIQTRNPFFKEIGIFSDHLYFSSKNSALRPDSFAKHLFCVALLL
ncbi:MAG: hypothetical protein ABJL67_05095, partial [Sulfitobacter sp.]